MRRNVHDRWLNGHERQQVLQRTTVRAFALLAIEVCFQRFHGFDIANGVAGACLCFPASAVSLQDRLERDTHSLLERVALLLCHVDELHEPIDFSACYRPPIGAAL